MTFQTAISGVALAGGDGGVVLGCGASAASAALPKRGLNNLGAKEQPRTESPHSSDSSGRRRSPPASAVKPPLARSSPAAYLRKVSGLYSSAGAIILGNIMEWYDWNVYSAMEDLIADIFFDGRSSATWLVFAVPFVARPLGSLFLGWVGDRFGRVVALNAAIWGMALSTVLQGCIPVSMPGAAGIFALLRIISGLSAGGESAGVNTYMAEVGGPDRHETLAAAVGVNNVSGCLAFFLANAVSIVVHALPRSEQVAWAWRVPFLAAAPIGVASVLLRRRMHETEAFERVQAAAAVTAAVDGGASGDGAAATKSGGAGSDAEANSSEGEAEGEGDSAKALAGSSLSSSGSEEKAAEASLSGSNAFAVALAVVVLAAVYCCNYLPVYMVGWLSKECGFTTFEALCVISLSKIAQLLATIPVSFFGDRLGLTPVMLAGGLASALCVLPSLALTLSVASGDDVDAAASVGEAPSAASQAIAFGLLGSLIPIPMATYNILSPLFVTSIFPDEFRGRGAGISLGLASLVGGFTPMICDALARQQAWYPGLFVTLLSVPSLSALLWARLAARSGALPVYQRPWLF